MQSAPTRKMRLRLNTAVFLVILAISVYVAFTLFDVSVLAGDFFKALANAQQMQSISINANRGTIYDRNGEVLAKSETVWQVIMSPRDLNLYDKEQTEDICKNLSEILDVDYETLLKGSQNLKNAFYIVKRKVEKPEIDKLNEYLLENEVGADSVYTIEESKRFYPNESLAANIIGFTNYDDEGVYGIEAYYDDYLKGIDGKVLFSKDANGNQMPFAEDMRYEAIDGNSLMLTVDKVLQHYLEKYLELAVSQNKVQNRATGIIMDPNTGAILAMATSPSYDPNQPATLFYQNDIDYLKTLSDTQSEAITEEYIEQEEARLRETQWKNKAVNELYIPGSVFKMFTASAALEEEVAGLNDTFYCPGYAIVSGTTIHCWSTGGHGTLTFTEAMIKSCNPSFMAIGERLGATRFSQYFEAFGFTEKTGIDLPGEEGSIYVSLNRMGPVELASSAFGQTNKVTPIQMITAISAVINGGKLMQPYVVDKIVDNNGNVIKTTQPTVKRQVISEETSATMRKILETVVEANGGNNAYINGYRIGGKSGTSEKIDKYNDTGEMYYVGTFAGFAPADDPQVVMLVCVDEPTGTQYYGSAVAAPVVSAVFKEGLPYLGIYPQYTADEIEDMDTTVPWLIGYEAMRAESQLNSYGLDVEFVGNTDGTTVVDQVPYSGSVIPKGGKVVLYMEDVDAVKGTVPDVYGLTLEEANEAITNAGFNMRTSGGAVKNANARAVSQSISAGTTLTTGNIIEVTFIVNDETG